MKVIAATDKNKDGVLMEDRYCALKGHGKGKGKMQ